MRRGARGTGALRVGETEGEEEAVVVLLPEKLGLTVVLWLPVTVGDTLGLLLGDKVEEEHPVKVGDTLGLLLELCDGLEDTVELLQ